MSGITLPVPPTKAVEPVPTVISLTEVANWDGKSQEIRNVLTTAFNAGDYPECIKNLPALHIEPQLYINKLNLVSLHSIPKHLA